MSISIGIAAFIGGAAGGVVASLLAGELPLWRLAIIGGVFGFAFGEVAQALVAAL